VLQTELASLQTRQAASGQALLPSVLSGMPKIHSLPPTLIRAPPQKQELLVALKKAGRLVDVLRRQKVHLEAAALLQVSSRELAEALQQGGR